MMSMKLSSYAIHSRLSWYPVRDLYPTVALDSRMFMLLLSGPSVCGNFIELSRLAAVRHLNDRCSSLIETIEWT